MRALRSSKEIFFDQHRSFRGKKNPAKIWIKIIATCLFSQIDLLPIFHKTSQLVSMSSLKGLKHSDSTGKCSCNCFRSSLRQSFKILKYTLSKNIYFIKEMNGSSSLKRHVYTDCTVGICLLLTPTLFFRVREYFLLLCKVYDFQSMCFNL